MIFYTFRYCWPKFSKPWVFILTFFIQHIWNYLFQMFFQLFFWFFRHILNNCDWILKAQKHLNHSNVMKIQVGNWQFARGAGMVEKRGELMIMHFTSNLNLESKKYSINFKPKLRWFSFFLYPPWLKRCLNKTVPLASLICL